MSLFTNGMRQFAKLGDVSGQIDSAFGRMTTLVMRSCLTRSICELADSASQLLQMVSTLSDAYQNSLEFHFFR